MWVKFSRHNLVSGKLVFSKTKDKKYVYVCVRDRKIEGETHMEAPMGHTCKARFQQ